MNLLKRALNYRKRFYYLAIIFGLICIVSTPTIVHADIFGFEVQDVYVRITSNVKETNSLLKKAFEFAQTSPYDVINGISGTAQGDIATNIRNASKSTALAVATLLLMVDFFRKSVSFEWSSKWENVLIFLIKIIAIKQVVQNADVIISHIYAGFQYINNVATGNSPNFLPCDNVKDYYVDIKQSLVEQAKKGWWDYWYDKGAGENYNHYVYPISEDAIRMFYPDAVFPSNTDLGDNKFPEPTTTMMFMPTLEIAFNEIYFYIMKAIAIIIFVIVIGRVFELSVYTIFAPLPLATFASDTTHDVAKNFIKNYIATVLQIAVIAIMFIAYVAINKYFTDNSYTIKLIQFVELIALGLGVIKSGAWSKKVCGLG